MWMDKVKEPGCRKGGHEVERSTWGCSCILSAHDNKELFYTVWPKVSLKLPWTPDIPQTYYGLPVSPILQAPPAPASFPRTMLMCIDYNNWIIIDWFLWSDFCIIESMLHSIWIRHKTRTSALYKLMPLFTAKCLFYWKKARIRRLFYTL